MPDAWITPEQWERTKQEIIARGKIDRDFPIPDEPRWQRLNDRQRAWAKAYFSSGGDSRIANDAAQFNTPAHLTLYRFLGDETPATARMRTYIAAMNQALKDGVGGGAVADAPASGEAFVPIPATDPASETPTQPPSPPSSEIVTQPPIYVPEIIETRMADVDPQEQERDIKTAQKVFRSAASYTPGDFMILERDEETNAVIDWRWDLEKLKKAPAGVLKTLSRDGKGQTKVEFESAVGAAKLMADHYRPSENQDGRVDVRMLVVNVLSQGDPAARYRLDQLAKEAAERLKADREKKQLAG